MAFKGPFQLQGFYDSVTNICVHLGCSRLFSELEIMILFQILDLSDDLCPNEDRCNEAHFQMVLSSRPLRKKDL